MASGVVRPRRPAAGTQHQARGLARLKRRPSGQSPRTQKHQRCDGRRGASRAEGSKSRRLFIVTGVSGAGKSQALKCFEDLGFFCVDNLPIALLPHFANLLRSSRGFELVALGMDAREEKFFKDFSNSLEYLRDKGIDYKIVFLDASDAALVQRFSETRHRHPLGTKIAEAIREERRKLHDIKGAADRVIDTSSMTLGELKEILSSTLEVKRSREMNLSVVSFGYKFGIPLDADLVLDVRFLPNPNYVPGLRAKTGLDSEVRRYLWRVGKARRFIDKYLSLVKDFLPHYVREGKSYLTIAVGCTGGRHRSVAVAHYLAEMLASAGYGAREFHRDAGK